jgi:glycosyltransferase involved in cell wall biosynthesis
MSQRVPHVHRVLLLAPQMSARGTCEYTVNLARELKDCRVDVGVFCVPGPSLHLLERAEVAVDTFDDLAGVGFRLGRRRFLAAVRGFAPQIVHAQSSRAADALRLLSRRTGLPLMLTVHGLPDRPRGVLRLSRLLAGVVATTQSVREGLVNQCRVERTKIEVIHNGIDVAGLRGKPTPPIFRSELPVVGSVGPVEEQRGHELFIRAVASLVASGVSAGFVVAGEGGELPGLRRLIADLGLEKWVTVVTGFTTYDEVLGALDIVVQSSLVDVSGFSILEAMGRGRPVVAFNTGTACELVADSQTGLLVPKGDVGALAESIRSLVSDKQRAMQMGRNARVRVNEHFDMHDIARRTLAFYSRVLAAASSPV